MIKNIYSFLFLILVSTQVPLQGEETKKTSEEQLVEAFYNPWNWPALHYALYQGYEEAALSLFSENTALESTPQIPLVYLYIPINDSSNRAYIDGYEEGIGALELALRFNHPELALSIISAGAPINESRKEFYGELTYDDYNKYKVPYKPAPPVLYRFVGSYYLWDRNFYEATPLYWAITTGHADVVQALLEQGASLDHIYKKHSETHKTKEDIDLSAVDIAAKQGNDEILRKVLFEQSHRLKALDLADESQTPQADLEIFKQYANDDRSVLFQAINADQPEDFAQMLIYGIDLDLSDSTTLSLFEIALNHTNPLFIQALYDYIQQHSAD